MTTAIDFLLSSQHESGGWGYSTRQKPVVEPTSAVLLALRNESRARDAIQKGIDWLIKCQHEDGGWGIHQEDPESGWQSSWAILALKNFSADEAIIAKGIGWLLTEGTSEISQDEFRKPDIPLSENNSAFIWPWMPGQVGWLEPTAMAVLALDGLTDSPLARYRMHAAWQYFNGNRTPEGGWNIGNAGPLDTIVLARAYPTTLVILALVQAERQEILPEDITALKRDLQRDSGILALSSALLALRTLGSADKALEMKIIGKQKEDGSWLGNPFYTAWATFALRGYFCEQN